MKEELIAVRDFHRYAGITVFPAKIDISMGKMYVPKAIEWREHTPYEVDNPRTAFNLQDTEAQKLMDSLWSCGIRPTEGAGSAGAMAATQKHLLDLQKVITGISAIKLTDK